MSEPIAVETQAIAPCPFCGGKATLSKVARDWYRITADHLENCPLEAFEVDCPQTDEQLPLLLRDWNARAFDEERAQLKAQNERLRAALNEPNPSADRYQWLREQKWFQWALDDQFGLSETLAEQDEQIDAARGAGEQP
ncbi:hypothetical protein [Pseudomonas gingeri]|uniref:hypothetical protein n=1 Tax=Pseudomonas gingeri TaxID=117681 RepID=UPI0015A13B88|nr:hypothetical protein [Pseudomonas gingeri]NWA11926.1 hypothetical protein [Pseudomonas gingeri]